MNRTTSTLVLSVSLLFIFNIAQAQSCLRFEEIIITPCSGESNGEINIVNIRSEIGQPPYSFSWSDGLITSDSSRTGMAVGDYTLTITAVADTGLCTEILSYDLVAREPVEIEGSVIPASCSISADGNIGISVTGNSEGYTINWSNGETNKNIGNLLPGAYSVSVYGDNNCLTTADYVVGADSIAINGIITDATCSYTSDGRIDLTVIGNSESYFYQWSNGASADNINSNLAPGIYSVTVTSNDDDACSASASFVVGPSPIQVDPNTTDVTCVGNDDGSITINVSGGNGGFLHFWNTGATGPVLNLLSAGIYTDSIVDGSGCSILQAVVVNNPPLLELTCAPVSPDVSQQTNTGSFLVQANGGRPPYSLSWSGVRSGINGSQNNIQDSLLINSLPSDEYIVTITDANDCVDTCSVFVEEYFVVKEKSLFILEFDENTPGALIKQKEAELLAIDNVIRKKVCNCEEDTSRLQLWYTENRLDINTSGETGTSKPKGDTSGLAIQLLIPKEIIIAPTVNLCTHSEGATNLSNDSIIVAIIDSGTNLKVEPNDHGHPALKNLHWTNGRELAGDKIDNDNNCCIDDRFGFDYLNNDGIVIDSVGHGTHLAGIIADAYPKDIHLKLINLKIYGEDSNGKSRASVFDLACAIHYAIDHGAKVINLSLGYFDKEPSKALYRALKKAEDKDILIVISSGNDDFNLDNYEKDSLLSRWPGRFNKNVNTPDSTLSALKNIIVVAALNALNQDIDTTYSNYSPTLVDLATNANFVSTHLDTSYLGLKGTSMSAAYLSRIFSIVRARDTTLSAESIIESSKEAASPIRTVGRLITNGRFNESAFLQDLGLSSIVTRNATIPAPVNLILGLSKVQFKDQEPVNFWIKLGDGTVYFQDVIFEIFEFGKTTNPVYSEHLCLANFLQWNGDNQSGVKVIGGTYQFKVTIGEKEFTSQTHITIGG